DNFKEKFELELENTPFSAESFYISSDAKSVGRHPYHHAGMFYVQEPSATSAVEVLNVKPNDKVLDLCAAPGGKSTQIAAKLRGGGVLFSNEFVGSRAKILLSNIERMGVKNAVVTSMHPEKLCEKLSGYFNKILVDAPCSGEGMFKKEPKALDNWSAQNVRTCAVRQLAILNSAKNALSEGGEMVYSTCTFSVEENEGVVFKFLAENPDFELIDAGVSFGRRSSSLNIDGDKTKLSKMVRILPMDKGEGHFVAKFRKNSYTTPCKEYQPKPNKKDELTPFYKFYDENFIDKIDGLVQKIGENIYILPRDLPDLSGLNILRAGVLAGRIKQTRFEPEHHIYTSKSKEEFQRYVNLSRDDARLSRYLQGEMIDINEDIKNGYTAILVDNVTLGFGKIVENNIKNHYPKGLRNL
ncbi:MAG: RsmB/NOP family class I SAM-dependent RNA methyltransferase, partial [Oscillospiraceae bacterium]|nr:RsmB/NOP family class I SAM-dependent RNA methyltransferase [Oscillospiraceae bacterium]